MRTIESETDVEMFRRWELQEWQEGQQRWQPEIGADWLCQTGRSSASEETRDNE